MERNLQGYDWRTDEYRWPRKPLGDPLWGTSQIMENPRPWTSSPRAALSSRSCTQRGSCGRRVAWQGQRDSSDGQLHCCSYIHTERKGKYLSRCQEWCYKGMQVYIKYLMTTYQHVWICLAGNAKMDKQSLRRFTESHDGSHAEGGSSKARARGDLFA